MPRADRIVWASTIVVVDLVLFVLPLAALFAAYVLLARPPWFKGFVEQLYRDPA